MGFTSSWNLSSRVHRLNQFPQEGVNCYVKRDDELGCGISGSKLRKYATLIPFFIENGIKHVIIIAGPQSNNLLAALQLCREFRLNFSVFLIKPKSSVVQGNYKLSRLFLEDKDIIWLERDEWGLVNEKAEAFLKQLEEPGFILNEGASVAQAMPGSMTLADDIINNEQQLNIHFDHIFIDAGTGFSAISLIQGLSKHRHRGRLYVLLLADNEEAFQLKLKLWSTQQSLDFLCFLPTTAKAFGSVNSTIKAEVKRVAREEGILVEPIYSAKLFHETRLYIQKNSLKGNALIIHSGGALTLAGFDF